MPKVLMPTRGTRESRSRWPYYNKRAAAIIKVVADEMLTARATENRNIEVYLYQDQVQVNLKTLQSFISQGASYLMDFEDFKNANHVYRDWRYSTITKLDYANKRVVIAWRIEKIKKKNVKPVLANEGLHEVVDWRPAFEEFLMGSGEATLDIGGVVLLEDDVEYIKSSTAGLSDMEVVSVTENRILIKRK